MQSKENIAVLGHNSSAKTGFFDRALYLVALMGADLTLLVIMTIILVFAVNSLGGHIRWFQASVGLPLAMMGLAVVYDLIKFKRRALLKVHRVLRDWLPFLFISFIYENLHDVAGRMMTRDIAGWLYNMDVAIFGVEPTVWIQKIFHPVLTDIMAVSYAMYFFLPLSLMFILSVRGKRWDFRHMSLCLTFVFLFGFLCYIFLPANPPRYFITEMFTDPPKLYGLFIYNALQSTWDGLSVISGGAFPSLHVGISSVVLLYAFKFRNRARLYQILFWIYLPLVVSLWISTVYLRHHWFVDIVAGWSVAVIGLICSTFLMKFWNNLQSRFGLHL